MQVRTLKQGDGVALEAGRQRAHHQQSRHFGIHDNCQSPTALTARCRVWLGAARRASLSVWITAAILITTTHQIGAQRPRGLQAASGLAPPPGPAFLCKAQQQELKSIRDGHAQYCWCKQM